MANDRPVVKISVTLDGKQWFIYPSEAIKEEVKKRGILPSGFGVHSVGDVKIVNKIRDITDLILEKKTG